MFSVYQEMTLLNFNKACDDQGQKVVYVFSGHVVWDRKTHKQISQKYRNACGIALLKCFGVWLECMFDGRDEPPQAKQCEKFWAVLSTSVGRKRKPMRPPDKKHHRERERENERVALKDTVSSEISLHDMMRSSQTISALDFAKPYTLQPCV